MKNNIKHIIQLSLIISFFIGLYIYANSSNINEKLTTCPNLLIKKGNLLYLNTEPPIIFKNLDEYITYLEEEKNKGNMCPVLFMQEENNTQGQDVYRIRDSPFETKHVTPIVEVVKDSSRISHIYNTNMYPGFDPTNQYNGVYTNIDAIHDSTNTESSENPADSNWGGIGVTEDAIQTGKYSMDEVQPPKLNINY
jgi:hypothetical protein